MATGAFRTSPAISLYAEVGIPSLKLRRMTLTTNFLASTAANPTLPINQHLFETLLPTPETLHPRYNLYLSLNRPFRFHYLPPIYADTPPWLPPTP